MKYFKPIITEIKLDARSAILAACSDTGGIYFTANACYTQSGAQSACDTAVKTEQGLVSGDFEATDPPS